MNNKKTIFHNEIRYGWGCWNRDLIKEPVLTCSICYDELDVLYKNGKPVWTKGHSSEPVNKGRCCNYCNDTEVMKQRLNVLSGNEIQKNIYSTITDSEFLEGQERLLHGHMQLMISYLQNKKEKLKLKKGDKK